MTAREALESAMPAGISPAERVAFFAGAVAAARCCDSLLMSPVMVAQAAEKGLQEASPAKHPDTSRLDWLESTVKDSCLQISFESKSLLIFDPDRPITGGIQLCSESARENIDAAMEAEMMSNVKRRLRRVAPGGAR